ncbi:CapA family protein [Streptomyces sp. H34-S4]|uniref:CapA family protein n=1 Tax=Streptomyces sp. H34-S4 TaxID=2996463 RepID=UPI0022710B26|nr:CapA family protein [Streptomyces sp. H34-S4]MCY0939311.1 CapA family protein [Streptomyces sp. H34-S4]
MSGELVTVFLAGDVMLGRGVDQILPHPGDPVLAEAYVTDARTYVELAEAVNGAIPRRAAFSWPWGEALRLLDAAAPDARILNLESSVTRSDDAAPGKAVHYRMHPANLPCLAAARPDVCVLANNHVLDYGRRGLAETLDSLAAAGLATAGAGRDLDTARQPAVLPLPGDRRLLVFSLGMASSGIPHNWAATADRSGIDFVTEASDRAAAAVADRIRREKGLGDLAVVSIHWGSNWGYAVPRDHVRFAHALVDGGADVVHGHSSHHPRPIEVYGGRSILYGCGDLIDDYEGISGYERYRDDLRLLYLVSLEPDTGRLDHLRIIPLQAHRMRLRHASQEDTAWLHEVLARTSLGFGTRITRDEDGTLRAEGGRLHHRGCREA